MARLRTTSIKVFWSDSAPDDPFEEIMLPPDEQQSQVPPEGAIESDDPMYADRYAGEQFIHSISQFYDNAWPIDAAPVAA